ERRRRGAGDAGIALPAREGAGGLTHRAVESEAGLPVGTASSYCRSREAVVTGLFDRIGARLAPTPEDLAARADEPPSRALFAAYVRDIVRRLTTHREVTLALYELRLEAARRPDLARPAGAWQAAGTAGAGALPGGGRAP